MKASQTSKNISENTHAKKLTLVENAYLLVFHQSTLKLLAHSDNLNTLFKKPVSIGDDFSKIFISVNDIIENEIAFGIDVLQSREGKIFDALTIKSSDKINIIIEEANKQKNYKKHFNVPLKIHQSISLAEDKKQLYGVWLDEIEKLVDAAELSIFQFDDNQNWQVIKTKSKEGSPLYESMHFPETDWPTFIFKMLEEGIPYLGNDLNSKIKIHNTPNSAEDLSALPVSYAGDYTNQLWENMNYGSILLFPIHLNKHLWGTLAILHPSSLKLRIHDVFLLKQSTLAFGQQLQVLRKADPKKKDSKALYACLGHISKYKSVQEAVKEHYSVLMDLLQASGLSLFLDKKLYNFGKTPPDFVVKEIEEKLIEDLSTSIYHTDEPALDVTALKSFKSEASGLLVVKLQKESNDFLIWYRPNLTKVIQWAGNPYSKKQIEKARKNFDSWIEVKNIGPLKWENHDLFFAEELGNHLRSMIAHFNEKEREKEKVYDIIFKHSPELISILREDLSIKYVNDNFSETFGINANDGTRFWEDLVHPQDYTKLIKYHKEIRNSKIATKGIEYRLKNRHGKYLHLETIASNHINDPIFKGILCISRDNTTRVNALNRLYKFQKIIEKTNSAVLIIDTQRQAYPITYTNKGVAHFSNNRTRQAVVGRSWQLINQHIEDNVNASRFKKALKDEKPIETTLKMKFEDENVMWVRAQVSPLEEANNAGKLVIILSDITEEIVAKEKLKEYSDKLHLSNEELQTFAYVASHDLQEPLRTISGFSELFSELYQDKIDEEANEYLTFILQATGRMKTLINDLLHFSRLSTEKGFIKEVNVKDILEKATDNLHTLIEENKAVITHDLLPNIFVNETLLLQVFQNLISNAIKYRSENQPIIHITAKYEKNSWVFGINDNGIGISKKYFDRIFIIFQRLHTTDKYSGTGIGLAICKKIIEKYGGRIWVESDEGKGSTFYFTIPDVLTLS